jgi:hypothetical protein
LGSDVIGHRGHAQLSGTVSTTVKRAFGLDSVAYDLAATVLAHRGELMNGTLEAVECMRLSSGDDLEGEIVVVAADLTSSHRKPP